MRRPLAILTVSLATALGAAEPARAIVFHLSTEGGETVDSQFFAGDDVFRYDDFTSTAAPFYNGPAGEELDAFDLLDNGDLILSFDTDATVGGQSFDQGQLIQYDAVNDIATLLFDGSPGGLFGPGGGDIDAVAVLDNGHILLSTADSETLGGLSFRDGDVVEWAPTSATTGSIVGLVFDENWFGPDSGVNTDQDLNLDAFDVVSSGIFALSHFENVNALLGGQSFSNGSVLLYDINNDTATIWLDEGDVFSSPANVDAVAVPEPGSSALFALGLVGLALAGRRRPR